MSYLVLARKYRPETFAKVVGQEPIARTLQNAIRAGRLAHAYLFTGPRGVGKTSLARILAKALLCERGPTPEPCLQCTKCKAVTAGNDLDVIEIDGASNRGIENIRDLRENVRYAATGGGHKVYIVDEVHQITQDAFNAFLKTLEEPPPRVVFVFATTEPRKVPETIRSRCQEFEFRRIPDAAIAAHLREVCAGEGFALEEGLDVAIARRARGGLRDALSLLDQLAAFGGGAIRHDAFRELTGFLAPEKVRELFARLLARDVAAALAWLGEALEHGAGASDLIDQWLEHLRALLHRRAGAAQPPKLAGVADDALAGQARELDETQLLGMMQVLVESRRTLRELEDERLVLEMTIVELARLRDLQGLRDAIQQLSTAPSVSSSTSSTSSPPRIAAPSRPIAASAAAAAVAPAPIPSPDLVARPSPAAGPAARLEQLRTALFKESPSLAALLENVEAEREENGVLLVTAKGGGQPPALPNLRLDEATRRLGRKQFGGPLVLRGELPQPTASPDSNSPRRGALDQIKELFGGETVSGGDAS